MNDDELIAQRRIRDQRLFLITSLDPTKAPRNHSACRGIREALLAADGWAPYGRILAAGLRDSDISVKTVDNLIRQAVSVGFVERRGKYTRGRPPRDARELRLVEWPQRP